MRFKDFLKEAKHQRDISLEKAADLIKANCSIALAHFDTPLWRGMASREEAYFVHGELSTRFSANTSNHYTVILDHFLPAHGFPKRSKSTILATNASVSYVDDYGILFAIFPYDRVKFGVADEVDIWYTTFELGNSGEAMPLEEWNQLFMRFDVPDTSYRDIVQGIRKAMESGSSELTTVFGSPDEVEEVLQTAYSPEKLLLNVASIEDIYSKYNKEKHELWTSGELIAVRRDQLDELEKLL